MLAIAGRSTLAHRRPGIHRRGALRVMEARGGVLRPYHLPGTATALTAEQFRRGFGVDPADVDRIDFRGRGLSLKMA